MEHSDILYVSSVLGSSKFANSNASDADSTDHSTKDFKSIKKKVPWKCLISLIIMNMLLGFLYYSIAFLYMEYIEYFGVSRAVAGWVGSIQISVSLMSGVFISAPLRRVGSRTISLLAGILVFSSMLTSAFASNIWILYFTFGILGGISTGMLYLVIAVVSQENFTHYRSMLTGLLGFGYGLGNFIISPLIVLLIDSYGWRGAQLILAAILMNLVPCAMLIPPLKNSLPEEKEEHSNACCMDIRQLAKDGFGFSLCLKTKFLLFNVGTLLVRLSNSAFLIHAPASLVHYGISKQDTAFVIMVQSAANLTARPIVGVIGGLPQVNRQIMAVFGCLSVSGAFFCISLWSTFTGAVVAFILYALFLALFASLNTVCLVDLLGVENIGQSFPVNCFFFGLSCLISPPFTGWLFDLTKEYNVPHFTNAAFGLAGSAFMFAVYLLQRTSSFQHPSLENNINSIEKSSMKAKHECMCVTE